MKAQTNINRSVKNNTGVDLREMFAYKLLGEIRVGPSADFIRNVHNSKYELYITTKEGSFMNLNDFVNFLNLD